MTWISLVCLLALSSAAFGQSSYGVFSGSSLFKPKPVVPAPLPLPTPVADIPLRPAPVFSNNYGSYDKFESRKLSFDLPKPATLPLSEADILCKGKPEGHIIVLLAGEKFVICTTDSKGDEFFCPKGLLYNDETKRCERKFNPNKNPCASQPCLNGGRCIPTQYTYQCECSQGFSGRTCELDASVCQQQQPCGQSFDSFCQSFLVGSALKHVCILQDGRSYGLTGQQTYSNPCLTSEGIHPLAFGNKGFIMCDGDSMFVESCPGETIWDPLTKVCSWADLPTQPVSFGLGFSAPLALPRLTSEPENRAASEASVESSNIDIETPTTAFSRVVAPMSVLPDAVRGGGGGGGGGGGDDFLRRNFESSSFQPSVGFSGSLGGSGDDFQRRTFSGGVFRPSSETGGVIRGPGGLPLPGRAGATSATESVGEFDNFRRRNFLGDDSDSSSIPFSPRPMPTNPSRSPGEIDRSSSFINRPGASSSGLNLLTRRNRF